MNSADDAVGETEVVGITVVTPPGREAEGAAMKACTDTPAGRKVQARVFKTDREWFQRHPGRRYRMRPPLVCEVPINGVTHMLVVRQSRRVHYRLGWRLRESEAVPNTERELAALLGIETMV